MYEIEVKLEQLRPVILQSFLICVEGKYVFIKSRKKPSQKQPSLSTCWMNCFTSMTCIRYAIINSYFKCRCHRNVHSNSRFILINTFCIVIARTNRMKPCWRIWTIRLRLYVTTLVTFKTTSTSVRPVSYRWRKTRCVLLTSCPSAPRNMISRQGAKNCPLTRTVSEPVSVAVAFNVYHCANGDELECLTDILEPILFVSVNLTGTVAETARVNGP